MDAIHKAAENADYNALIKELDRGVSVNQLTKDRNLTPLMCCVVSLYLNSSDRMQCVDLLLKHGASINYQGEGGETALSLCIRKSAYTVLSLLERKADTHNRDYLTDCQFWFQDQQLSHLLEFGAEITLNKLDDVPYMSESGRLSLQKEYKWRASGCC